MDEYVANQVETMTIKSAVMRQERERAVTECGQRAVDVEATRSHTSAEMNFNERD